MHPIYIGIAGVARSGKDTFADLLQEEIQNYVSDSCTIFRSALAKPLKDDCAEFLKEKLGLDVYSSETEVKSTFRELLVWYGKVQREKSNGKHWTKNFEVRAVNAEADVCIVTDVRYQQYEQDELHWLKTRNKGVLIYIQRTDANGKMVPAANMDEKINDSILRESADHIVNWPTFVGSDKLDRMKEYAVQAFQNGVKQRLDAK